ncbi:MAG: DUF4149 domain-containing protein [Saprospiraceae bacterium]|nr:DUF4149 domain-containing protein [Saprospiraceae bacterium]
MNHPTTVHLLISGFIVGIIFFQTALSAPIVFKYLQKDQSSIYIRKIFPRLFILISVLGLSITSVELLNKSGSFAALLTAILSIVLPVICYLMVPATNKATDSGNHKKFKQLHTISVLFIVVVFFANLLWPFV